MPTLLNEREQECLRCRVPKECKPAHHLCGISRGIKYGFYPESAHSRPSSGLPGNMVTQATCGFPEQPLYRQNEGFGQFCKDVIKYREDGLVLINDFTGVDHG